MKKRLFFLVILAFLLCGCTARVNISINDSTISERISISEAPYGEATINDIAQQYRKYIPAFKDTMIVDTMPDVATEGVKYYRTSGTATNNIYNAYYQFDYNFKEYKNATSINNAFKSSMVQYDAYEKEILISTESSGITLFSSYPQLEEITINISTNYRVKENNADYVSGNVYTWVFNKSTKKGVYLLLEDLNGKSVGGNTEKPSKQEDPKKDPEKEEPTKDPGKGNNNGGNSGKTKKEEEKSAIEKGYEKFKEEGSKHPHIVVFVFLGLFLFIIIISFRVKKV